MITECANCYAVAECIDDGEAYICTDRAACQQRAAAEIDWTPRQHTAKVPIFCQQCRKQGRAVYLKGDDPRIIRENGSGYYRGPTMRLTAYLAGAPRVCLKCDRTLMDAIGVFSEQE